MEHYNIKTERKFDEKHRVKWDDISVRILSKTTIICQAFALTTIICQAFALATNICQVFALTTVIGQVFALTNHYTSGFCPSYQYKTVFILSLEFSQKLNLTITKYKGKTMYSTVVDWALVFYTVTGLINKLYLPVSPHFDYLGSVSRHSVVPETLLSRPGHGLHHPLNLSSCKQTIYNILPNYR